MRNRRVALIIAIYAVGLAAAVYLLATASPSQEALASWSSIHLSRTIPSEPRADLLTTANLAPLAVFATAVEDNQAAAAFAAAEAALSAQLSSSTASPPPTAPTSTTTAPPAPSTVYSCDPYGGDAVARAVAAGVPCAWVPTAVCEEQGYNSPDWGYFGIQEWLGFDGIGDPHSGAGAGSATLDQQLAWEAAHGQGPPDAPGQCHGY